ncbi:MAG: ABC transporter permease [Candidatus Rokubacteria bacterium]|nr:ABC transporter permease [Candidatus Rokubacteria bacterium]
MTTAPVGATAPTARVAGPGLRWLARNLLGAAGAVIIAGWLVVLVVGPDVAPYSYRQVDVIARLKPPSSEYYFGTDALGRDVFSRVLVGTRVSLPSGFAVVLIAAAVGTLYGGVAAYAGAKAEEVMMRVTDLFLSFPPLILAMAIAAALGKGVINTIVAMAIVWWPKYARLSRSLVIVQRSLEYVEAAHALGHGAGRTLLRHIAPNAIGPIVVLLALDVGSSMITFAGLSFLGLGVVPPTPEWGAMVSEGQVLIEQWWVSAFPGLAIFSVVVGFNFLGDALRDWLDPRARAG